MSTGEVARNVLLLCRCRLVLFPGDVISRKLSEPQFPQLQPREETLPRGGFHRLPAHEGAQQVAAPSPVKRAKNLSPLKHGISSRRFLGCLSCCHMKRLVRRSSDLQARALSGGSGARGGQSRRGRGRLCPHGSVSVPAAVWPARRRSVCPCGDLSVPAAVCPSPRRCVRPHGGPSVPTAVCPSLWRSVHPCSGVSVPVAACLSLRRCVCPRGRLWVTQWSVCADGGLSIPAAICPSLRRSVHPCRGVSVPVEVCLSPRRSVHPHGGLRITRAPLVCAHILGHRRAPPSTFRLLLGPPRVSGAAPGAPEAPSASLREGPCADMRRAHRQGERTTRES